MGIFDLLKNKNKTVLSGLNGSNEYPSVKIGRQIWMLMNLDIGTFRDGSLIPEAKTDEEWRMAGICEEPAWCYYNNDPANGKIYGRLYNGIVIGDIELRELAPDGWHIPTNWEWETLENYFGGFSVAGGKLKEAGLTHWLEPNTDATNESGFSALPGGWRFPDGKFSDIGHAGYWWSQSGKSSVYPRAEGPRSITHNDCSILLQNQYKGNGYSIRCIKD